MDRQGPAGKGGELLVEGIIAVSLTEVMDRTMAGESVYPDSPPNPEFGGAAKLDLSAREQAVLRELTRNYTNEKIADRLHISVNTVRTHIPRMLKKTGQNIASTWR